MLFCGQHRYAEAHSCTFDYKSAEREKLAAANPLVQASKVERI
jgi:AN1-type zinc finger and ubiquitin domain-containing protein 1